MLRSANAIHRILMRRSLAKIPRASGLAALSPVPASRHRCHAVYRSGGTPISRRISTFPTRANAHVAYQQGKQVLKKGEDRSSYADPITRYEHLVKLGILKADDHQRKIIERLQRLHQDLIGYEPGGVPPEAQELARTTVSSLDDSPTDAEWSAGIWKSFSGMFKRAAPIPAPTVPLDKVPKGLYLYGSVGTGKTMLMDLFHSTLPPAFAGSVKHITNDPSANVGPPAGSVGGSACGSGRTAGGGMYGSTRIHFHSFMLDVLSRQHQVKAKYEKLGMGSKDAMPEVARSLAAEGRVLCFDEFQVTDIVTAMILRQLLERLMGFGVVCIMTSNRHPDDLYINGIQRQSFIPAIDLIKERFDVVDLDSGTDYRKLPRALSKVYFHPLSPSTHAEMSKLFTSLAEADLDSSSVSSLASSSSTSSASTELGGGYDNAIVSNRKISLWGRTIIVPESSNTVARFKFSDLCDRPLSAADYLEITNRFPTIFVEGVPNMGLSERDQARRFITFIDACYENRTKLFASSEVPIQQVFSDKSGKKEGYDAHMRSIMDDLGLSADEVGSSSLFSGDEELFAFARCVSRLTQMGHETDSKQEEWIANENRTQEWAESTR